MAVAGRARRGVGAWLAEASGAVVSVFFPARCRICDPLLTGGSPVPICEECLDSFEAVPDRKCKICGHPLPALSETEEEQLVCPACQEKTYAFERARS
jgi:predicted amidophosphoribosyltransferase